MIKGTLPDIISPQQSAFVPNRIISDAVFMAHELYHYVKHRKSGKKMFLAAKLDMRKAYERLEWPFIQATLLKLGFCNLWVNMVMNFISTVSYSLLVNGVKSGIASWEELMKRQLQVDPSCVRCGVVVESSDHILLECPFAKATWFGSSLSFIAPQDESLKLYKVHEQWNKMNFPSKKIKMEILSLFTHICWYLWTARNDMTFHRKEWSPIEVFSQVEQMYMEFWTIVDTTSTPSGSPSNNAAAWKGPPQGWLTLNCDAALPLENHEGGIGCISRDHNCSPAWALSEPLCFTNSLSGEALAVHTGFVWAIEHCIPSIIIESDNNGLINYINSIDQVIPARVLGIISDIRFLATRISQCSFSSHI
ncbi:uncharacterized protein LOC122084884 [Macadamia integrifolia]|uniref:uncharacterized protein LOC122084884 n=1 Tax=Macadamia integrifolia TaxID=60698 RepID=UPI001C4F5FA4|nr:uncharacterized protein LOC122084884 [Macadamia integrifolia]